MTPSWSTSVCALSSKQRPACGRGHKHFNGRFLSRQGPGRQKACARGYKIKYKQSIHSYKKRKPGWLLGAAGWRPVSRRKAGGPLAGVQAAGGAGAAAGSAARTRAARLPSLRQGAPFRPARPRGVIGTTGREGHARGSPRGRHLRTSVPLLRTLLPRPSSPIHLAKSDSSFKAQLGLSLFSRPFAPGRPPQQLLPPPEPPHSPSALAGSTDRNNHGHARLPDQP